MTKLRKKFSNLITLILPQNGYLKPNLKRNLKCYWMHYSFSLQLYRALNPVSPRAIASLLSENPTLWPHHIYLCPCTIRPQYTHRDPTTLSYALAWLDPHTTQWPCHIYLCPCTIRPPYIHRDPTTFTKALAR